MGRRKPKILTPQERKVAFERKRRVPDEEPSKYSLFSIMSFHGKNRYLFGYRVQQNAPSIWLIDHLLSVHRPDLIVELGTGNGILTTYFAVYAMLAKTLSGKEVRIISVDRSPPKLHIRRRINRICGRRVHFLRANIFSSDTLVFITEAINKSENPFLLADGRDPKSREVNYYSPDLREGVVIFAHDASLDGANHCRWGFKEGRIDWGHVERYEPYYSWAKEGDTRMLCMKTKKRILEKLPISGGLRRIPSYSKGNNRS